MGLFGRKKPLCPICNEELSQGALDEYSHWLAHVAPIESGEGAGGYTWRCICGPSGMWWELDYQAASGLAVHMIERHGLSP